MVITGKLDVVILAAGKGTRMRSSLPKVLHRLAHKPLLQHVIDTAHLIDADKITVVYGHGGEQVKQTISDETISWCEQKEQLGTGHAVEQAVGHIADEGTTLVLYGDVPMLSKETLEGLLKAKAESDVAVLTTLLDSPKGYGRIVRDNHGAVVKIVEEKDADEATRAIKEVNTGVMAIDSSQLEKWLARIDSNNAQQEYYLTDVVELAVNDGSKVQAFICDNPTETEGVNNKLQLANLERYYHQLKANQLMTDGVTLMDPSRLDIRGTLSHGQDVTLDVNVIIEGDCRLGDNVTIGANSVIRDSVIGNNVTILENCVIDGAIIGQGCQVGPFARLRPGCELNEDAKVGNFVEIKKAKIGKGSKVNHLSYVGDTLMGDEVNVGAGTITCNYDGANKHVTVIGDNAFIGSNSALVAPVEVGAGATIGAGSTISRDAEENALTVCRAKQRTLKGWERPKKEK